MQALRSVATSNYSALTCLMRQRVLVPTSMSVLHNCSHQQSRNMSAEPLAVPTPEDAPKVYPEKIQTIVNQISQLTLVEVAELNALLKTTLNIPDAPVMAFGAAPGGPAAAQEEEEEEQEPVKVQTSFTLRMTKYDESRKVPLIKEVKAKLEGFNLVQAKKFVESCPCVVKADIPKDEAEQLAEAFKAVGAECVVE
ncbi:hypothetical protein Pmani_001857 [Petrolisthes manimaculis]|uniref:Mitochondrial ribosomal protein L12 n=1 Tax=Petrolisthes manimaculis TaxID=1843537 RepID=A0AAE1QJ71_9EUCA|nr:hypothetical protein Pmani_001857 [Petrolisthes manimaculis]